MSSLTKLMESKPILEKELSIYIKNLDFEPKLARIKITLRDGALLYVRYNNYNEYSYAIIYSKLELDRVRFDNYDDQWNVVTRPHHYHPRQCKNGFISPMNGNHKHDIPEFCNLIKSGKLISADFRFK